MGLRGVEVDFRPVEVVQLTIVAQVIGNTVAQLVQERICLKMVALLAEHYMVIGL
jgi:hypothetical protein